MIRRALVLGVLMSALVGCGDDGESDPLGISLIGPAVEAVRAETGVEPSFFEINSTSEGVTLFVVASEDSTDAGPGVRQARYTDGEGLVLSDEVLPASGETFSVSDWSVSPGRLTAEVFDGLRQSTPLMFVMTASADGESAGGIVLRVLMESDKGGRLAVFIDDDGTILGTDVLE